MQELARLAYLRSRGREGPRPCQAQEIARYGEIFDHLRATALSPRESVAFLEAVAAEFA